MAEKANWENNEKPAIEKSKQLTKVMDEDDIEAEEPEEEKLDDLFARLEEIISQMEEGNTSLEDSFQMYHKGMDLLKKCNDKIDKIEKKIQILDEEGGIHEFE